MTILWAGQITSPNVNQEERKDDMSQLNQRSGGESNVSWSIEICLYGTGSKELMKFSLEVGSSVQFSSVAQSCPTLRPRESQHARPPCSSPAAGVHSNSCHQVGDAIQPSHLLSSPPPPAPNPSHHQGLFQWVSSSHQVAKVLEFQLQHQSFQWTPRTDLL